MMHAKTAAEVLRRRNAFLARWKLALSRGRRRPRREAGARLFTFLRYPPGNGARSARSTPSRSPARGVQAPDQDPVPAARAETAAMLFWALLASGQITMRRVDMAREPSTVHPSTLTSPPDQPPCPRSRAAQFPPTSRHDPLFPGCSVRLRLSPFDITVTPVKVPASPCVRRSRRRVAGFSARAQRLTASLLRRIGANWAFSERCL